MANSGTTRRQFVLVGGAAAALLATSAHAKAKDEDEVPLTEDLMREHELRAVAEAKQAAKIGSALEAMRLACKSCHGVFK